MEQDNDITTFMKLLLIAGCVLLVGIGTHIVLKWSDQQPIPALPSSRDSSYTQNKVTDTAKKTVVTTTELLVKKMSSAAEAAAAVNSVQEAMMKKGYDLIFLGLVLLFLLFALPGLSEFSFLQLFSAKFRDKVEAGKAIINEAANAANTNLPIDKPQVEPKPVTEAQVKTYRNMVADKAAVVETIAAYAEDPQKGKWGGEPIINDRKLSATITPVPGNPELFKVQLKVLSTNPQKPLANKVVFHLHPTFPNSEPAVYVVQGEAKLELIAWGAFTVGAEADGGATRLELDLAELPEAPLLFKSR